MTWRSTIARSWQWAGTDPTHLLRVSVYLSDIRTAEHMYKAWNKYFEDLHLDEDNRPVRITHEARLKKEVFRVEVRPATYCPPRHPPHFRVSFLAPNGIA